MKDDVKKWVESCLTCARFRKIPQKAPSEAVIPVDADCWEEVMIDLEGPSQPHDKDGNRYGFTYVCCLCHGVLLDRSAKCKGHEARRMFSSCLFRSGRIPSLLRSDRGPELMNALMSEYCATVGIGRRFGTPYRPVEQ